MQMFLNAIDFFFKHVQLLIVVKPIHACSCVTYLPMMQGMLNKHSFFV